MTFENEKETFLAKKDKSTKGSIDEDIKDLLDKINSKENYYTTSSCSGRILLLDDLNKKTSSFLFVSHSICKLPKITQNCWLLVEPPIIHVRCKDLDSANILLKLALDSGFGKSGLISIEKPLLEINSTERISNYLTPNLDLTYLEELNNLSNKKLEKMKLKINNFYSIL